MVEKEAGVIEISPDSSEKTKTKKLKFEEEDDDDDGTPLRPILCVKNRLDLKRFEETDDCFILDFDPFESLDMRRLSVSGDHLGNEGNDGDGDLAIISEKGQVACRDYPHPRHLCLKFPFGTNSHETHCRLCYCYVCDLAAPCARWTLTGSRHCDATEHIPKWKSLRNAGKKWADTTRN